MISVNSLCLNLTYVMYYVRICKPVYIIHNIKIAQHLLRFTHPMYLNYASTCLCLTEIYNIKRLKSISENKNNDTKINFLVTICKKEIAARTTVHNGLKLPLKLADRI